MQDFLVFLLPVTVSVLLPFFLLFLSVSCCPFFCCFCHPIAFPLFKLILFSCFFSSTCRLYLYLCVLHVHCFVFRYLPVLFGVRERSQNKNQKRRQDSRQTGRDLADHHDDDLVVPMSSASAAVAVVVVVVVVVVIASACTSLS